MGQAIDGERQCRRTYGKLSARVRSPISGSFVASPSSFVDSPGSFVGIPGSFAGFRGEM